MAPANSLISRSPGMRLTTCPSGGSGVSTVHEPHTQPSNSCSPQAVVNTGSSEFFFCVLFGFLFRFRGSWAIRSPMGQHVLVTDWIPIVVLLSHAYIVLPESEVCKHNGKKEQKVIGTSEWFCLREHSHFFKNYMNIFSCTTGMEKSCSTTSRAGRNKKRKPAIVTLKICDSLFWPSGIMSSVSVSWYLLSEWSVTLGLESLIFYGLVLSIITSSTETTNVRKKIYPFSLVPIVPSLSS